MSASAHQSVAIPRRADLSVPRRCADAPELGADARGISQYGRVSQIAGPVDRVVVVGAGIAGLAAASSLRRAGVETVILEARSRIGGRLHTVDLAGTPVDLGGSWIHHPHRQSADGVLRRVRRSARPR